MIFVYKIVFADSAEIFIAVPKRDIKLAQALATVEFPGKEILLVVFHQSVQEAL